jgi:hypothetical protein
MRVCGRYSICYSTGDRVRFLFRKVIHPGIAGLGTHVNPAMESGCPNLAFLDETGLSVYHLRRFFPATDSLAGGQAMPEWKRPALLCNDIPRMREFGQRRQSSGLKIIIPGMDYEYNTRRTS